MYRPLAYFLLRTKHALMLLGIVRPQSWPAVLRCLMVGNFNHPAAAISLRGSVPTFYMRDRYDLAIFAEVFLEGFYDEAIRDLPLEGVVVDVGAHIGTFSAKATAEKQADVTCYEPNPFSRKVLELNSPNANIVPAAVGATAGTCRLSMPRSGDFSYSHILTSDESQEESFIDVPQVILKATRHIHLLKLDCEGSEYDILTPGLLSHCDAVVMEYHNRCPQNIFVANGFSMKKLWEKDGVGMCYAKRVTSYLPR